MMSSSLQSAILGGVFIGLAASWLYLIGLGIGGWIATLFLNTTSATTGNTLATADAVAPIIRWPWLIVGGVLVGFGTRMGSGCTSGHGVCGIARISPRSIAATCVFLGTGMLVATTIAAL